MTKWVHDGDCLIATRCGKAFNIRYDELKENVMEDLIPIETVLSDMESDCGIIAEAAKDYLNIHRDEYGKRY